MLASKRLIMTSSSGALVAPATTPSDLGVWAWFDAGVLSGDDLALAPNYSWTDRSETPKVCTNGTASRRPTLIANALNGLPAMRFTEASQQYVFNNTLNIGTIDTTIITVLNCRTNAANTDRCVGVGIPSSAGANRFFYRSINGTTVGFAGISSSTHTYDFGNFHIFGGSNSGNNITIMKDGDISAHTGSGLITMVAGLYLGGWGTLANSLSDTDICEVLIFSFELTIEQRQQVEGYLAVKYGLTANLPAGHPYK